MGYRLRGEHFRESTKTTNLDKATEIAKRKFHELEYRGEQGHALKGTMFSVLSDLYKVYLLTQYKKKKLSLSYINRQNIVIDTYLIKYFANTLLEHITEPKLAKYQLWRLSQVDDEPEVGTLNRERTVIRQMFKFAVEAGHMKKADVPCITNDKQKQNRRPHIPLVEYKRLLKRSLRRIRKAPSAPCKRNRQELHYWMCIMANTGMRPVEAKNLRWCDINDLGNTVSLDVQGKDKFGELVARLPAKYYLEKIRALRSNVKPTDTVWEGSFRKGFNMLLDDCGIKKDKNGKNRCPYSFRHTYATNMLVYKNTNIYTLARNMRTSVLMLEKHYSHLLPLQAKEELTK